MQAARETDALRQEESPKRRVDRELGELLEEIRVALPGVELLFGFLLILPFSERFAALDQLQRGVYLACLLTTAASAALFVAPSAQHRLGFRSDDKEQLLLRTNRQVIAALFLVAIAISLAVFLIVSVVIDVAWASIIAVAVGAWFATWWFLFPPFWRGRERPVMRAQRLSHVASGDI